MRLGGLIGWLILIERRKMTEYYTMKECFDACGDDDIPFIENGFNSSGMGNKKRLLDFDSMAVSLKDMLSNKWQIKRAEPVVLSADEYLKKNYNVNTDGDLILLPHHFIDVFNSADKNGQLREWLRPEQVELREAVKNYRQLMETGAEVPIEHCERVNKAIENLKPPYETKS
jgi:hypothetical protein